ncbi:hypothetical protein [Nocardioides pantholopis]|uniref:hypothetical protein n=1 Tax=Nocardioides pantholopis TaxID=2483798 RepID=UPI000F092C57|nr:hypothetical protein [Nocardioides pantholopis]
MAVLTREPPRAPTFRASAGSWRPGGLRLRARLDEHWPLQLFFYLFPLWWVLGLSHVILFVLAVPMLAQLAASRPVRVPASFGLYALFLVWVLLGAAVLWAPAPGTEPRTGLGPLVGFAYRGLWYAAITIACLYVLNASRRHLSAQRLGRMIAYLFLVTVAGGWAGLLVPHVDFPSAIELVLPQGFTEREFMNALFHPRIALESDFLGRDQARITAPYSYPNTWGNAFGVLLPFFVATWFGRAAGWRRHVAPLVLLAAVVPAVYSLNRGLWLGLAVAAAWVVGRRVLAGDLRALVAAAVGAAGVAAVLAGTRLGELVRLRLDNPHSDDRRQDTVAEVLRLTWEGSPAVGYGSTRQMVGNFRSLAGSTVADCHQCAAPPLGTQGFLWGLVFMTGIVGTALLLGFLARHLWLNARRPTSVALVASTVLVSSLFYFLFYDSLDVPLLITMLALGLAAREHAPETQVHR